MANFANISNTLEGILNTQLNATRQSQSVWEWYNALQRIMSSNRFTGTPKIYGAIALVDGSVTVETVPVTLFGVLMDNPHATENTYLFTSNVAAAGGNDDLLGGIYYAPAAAITPIVIPGGASFATALYVADCIATNAGLEAQSASTTQMNVVLVYTT